jgi:hypothetical protein
MKQFVLVLILLSSSVFQGNNLAAQNSPIIGQEQAAKVAATFVAAHNYNRKLKANEPSICWEETVESAGKEKCAHSDSIQSEAVKAFIKEENGRRFWSVQFLFRQQPAQREYDIGREVRVSLNGKKIWMNPTAIKVGRAHNPL